MLLLRYETKKDRAVKPPPVRLSSPPERRGRHRILSALQACKTSGPPCTAQLHSPGQSDALAGIGQCPGRAQRIIDALGFYFHILKTTFQQQRILALPLAAVTR